MLKDKAPTNEVVIACNLNAIPADQRQEHEITAKSLFAAVKTVRILPDGYAFQLLTTSEMLMKAAGFIANERLCCPFFKFALEVEPNGGPLWLCLTGDEGVKALIQAEFSAILNPGVVETGGLGN